MIKSNRFLNLDDFRFSNDSPEQKLAAAVITRALVDFVQLSKLKHRVTSRLEYNDVKDWLLNDDNQDRPYSFKKLCEFIAPESDLYEVLTTFLKKRDNQELQSAAEQLLNLGIIRASLYTERRSPLNKMPRYRIA